LFLKETNLLKQRIYSKQINLLQLYCLKKFLPVPNVPTNENTVLY
jgi:hypothetical protein